MHVDAQPAVRGFVFDPTDYTPEDYLFELAKLLRTAERIGNARDIPEGARIIAISDTLAQKIADELDRLIDELRDRQLRKRERD